MQKERYEKIENIILEQINKVHTYRMCYFTDLRNEKNWQNYLKDNINDGFDLIDEAIDKYLYNDCPATFVTKVLEWYHISNDMLHDFRKLLRNKYHRKYIFSTVRYYAIRNEDNDGN